VISSRWGAPASPERQLSTVERLVAAEAPVGEIVQAVAKLDGALPTRYPPPPAEATTSDLIGQMRARRDALRVKLAGVEAMRTELRLLEAMLALSEAPKEKES
jgi:hypothetical protein